MESMSWARVARAVASVSDARRVEVFEDRDIVRECVDCFVRNALTFFGIPRNAHRRLT